MIMVVVVVMIMLVFVTVPVLVVPVRMRYPDRLVAMSVFVDMMRVDVTVQVVV